jgi:hypothetical protein
MSDGASDERGVIEGSPLSIRSDEWLVTSPFILSQEEKNLPVSNEALGYGKVPLIMGIPAHHILSEVKPALWGYYFLDKERAFSWHWNFRIFPFLIASFLFLLLFTKNNFIVSLFGSIWLFLSSAIQWWSINTEIFTYGLVALISFIYILYSNKTRHIVINGVIFLLAAYSYAMVLYPAYQVPLAYFLLALLLAYIISRKDFKLILNNKWTKLSVLALSMISLLSLFFLFYNECKETIRVVCNTVYPGKRDETGGGFSFPGMFRDNFSWFVNQNTLPPKWGNICEQSSYLMLSPITTILIISSWIKTKKINPLFIPLLLFHLITYIWLFYGFPHFLSRITMFNISPAVRVFFIFGFSNVVFTLLYLGQFRHTEEKAEIRFNMAIVFSIIFVSGFVIDYLLNRQSDRFFTKAQVINATILFSILNWLIVYFSERKLFQYLFYIACLFFVAANVFINPLSRGLSPFFENKIYKTISQIKDKDPNAGWMAFGSLVAPDFLKAAGVNCFNGVQFAPPLEKLRILDPNLKYNDIYNRYAHILAFPLIDGKDSVSFDLVQPDLYTIKMDPSSPRLKRMGIKYLFFTYKPPEAEVRSLVPVNDTLGFYIYKRKDL